MDYFEKFGISQEIVELSRLVESKIQGEFEKIRAVSEYNQLKVLHAFHKNKISTEHFIPTSGYGYDDVGREAIDDVFADIFGTESAIVRHNIISGTHALSIALFGLLRPGDILLAATGKPYDTLEETIGLREGENGSLRDFGVDYKQVDLVEGEVDINSLHNSINAKTKVVLIQKSKGYEWRKSLSCAEIGEIVRTVKSVREDVICLVDNCYGEFVEECEPTEFGADLVAGSLIKNPGGGLAPTGGYLAGRAELVDLAAYKLNAVGMGRECGASLGFNKQILQGVFLAPHVVGEALCAAVFCGEMCEQLGFEVTPRPGEHRVDIIQAVKLGNRERVVEFCRGIQQGAPIDSFVTPEPWGMPGYQDEVVMAAGTFNQGSSIELSADGPIRAPYIAYMQGGLTYASAKIGIMKALSNVVNKKQ